MKSIRYPILACKLRQNLDLKKCKQRLSDKQGVFVKQECPCKSQFLGP